MTRSGIAVFIVVGLALAGPAGGQDYPAREVSRPLLMPRGLMQINLDVSSLNTNQVINQDSQITDAPGDYELLNILTEIEFGLLDSVQLATRLPYLNGRLSDSHGSGFGDAAAEVSVRFLNKPDLAQAAGLLRVSYPTGMHDFGQDIFAGQFVQTGWVTGDPSWDIYPGLEAKLIRPRWALESRVEYWVRTQGEVAQNIGALEKTADLDPGDGFFVRTTGLYQATDWLALRLGVEFTSLGENEVNGKTLSDQSQVLLVKPSCMVQFNREFDVYLGLGYTAWGKNTGYGFPWMVGFRSRF